MYFKVYHKRSKQLIATFNERTIVDFCLNNEETVKNYYFSTGGQKDLLEWEVFAVKHSDLFEKKASERDKKEFGQVEEKEEIDTRSKKSRLPFLVILLSTLAAALITFVLYRQNVAKEEASAKIRAQVEAERLALAEQRAQEAPIEKRALTESDKSFTATMPSQKELEEIWKKSGVKEIPDSLDFETIKDHMDALLPDVEKCFNERVKAGDRSLKGTLNMQIRLSGDGVVRDVVLKDEKYIGSLFGDCLIDAIKSKPFKFFRSREQVFSYYWDL
jgi:hypothetical protein